MEIVTFDELLRRFEKLKELMTGKATGKNKTKSKDVSPNSVAIKKQQRRSR